LEFQVAVQLSVFVLVALSPSKARRVGLGLCVRAKSSRLDTQTHKRMVGSWKRRQTMDDDAWKCPIKITYTQRVPEAAALCHEACGNWQKIKAQGNKVNPLTPQPLQNSSQTKSELLKKFLKYFLGISFFIKYKCMRKEIYLRKLFSKIK